MFVVWFRIEFKEFLNVPTVLYNNKREHSIPYTIHHIQYTVGNKNSNLKSVIKNSRRRPWRRWVRSDHDQNKGMTHCLRARDWNQSKKSNSCSFIFKQQFGQCCCYGKQMGSLRRDLPINEMKYKWINILCQRRPHKSGYHYKLQLQKKQYKRAVLEKNRHFNFWSMSIIICCCALWQTK